VEDFVHISPNAALAGNVKVGEGTQIGIGACVMQNIRIGKWAIIGAGAVIIRDVPDYAVVVGNPGRVIKRNQN
jgi:acetyltransferase EpsM